METKDRKKGYVQNRYAFPTKRYCQTLELKDNPQLIEEYVKRHDEMHHWPEIREGIRSVGILEMEIYLLGTNLFMVVETPLDFDWDTAFDRLTNCPKQNEWEEYMSVFQNVASNASSAKKWELMDRIFHLYK